MKRILLSLIAILAFGLNVSAQDYVYLIKDNAVVAKYLAEDVDYLSFTLPEGVVDPSDVETVIWEGDEDLNSWTNNIEIKDVANSTGDCFKGQAQEGTVLRIYLDAYDDWSQIKVYDGHWSEISFTNNGESSLFDCNMEEWLAHPTYHEVVLTADEAERLNTNYDWGYCMIVQGQGANLKKITIK